MSVEQESVSPDGSASEGLRAAPVVPAIYVERATEVLAASGTLLALLALGDLAVRAALRLELRWDTFLYHLPFAALRGGLPIPYDMNDLMRDRYEGFPLLADLVQGALWRLTGSINATGVVNYLAFVAFLVYCHFALRARFWLVALIALTAPMVVIHTTVSYVDLFGNSLLAIGMSSCLHLYLFPERRARAVLLGGLTGLIGAAWTKFNLVPVVGLGLCLCLAVSLRRPLREALSKRRVVLVVVAAAMLAAVPYIKNIAVYGNPFWPIRVPVVATWFPYKLDAAAENVVQRPPPLREYTGARVFVHSLLELNHPTRYADRPRWIIDQGNAWIAFRTGGYWVVGVVFYVVTMMTMLVAHDRRTGTIAGLAAIATLGLVAILPQSHDLRYYMFIPLTWAAAVGMLFPQFKRRSPMLALVLLTVMLGLFSYMVSENRVHYRISKVDYLDAARAWGADQWWPRFQRGETYCAVGMDPIGMMLTGPTMSEYSIVDRSHEALCPDGTIVVTKAGVHDVVHRAETGR